MKKTKKKWLIAATILLCLILIFTIRHFYNINTAFFVPRYEKSDISALLDNESRSEKEDKILFKQTGLSPYAIDEMLRVGDRATIKKLHELYFKKPQTELSYIAYPVTAEEINLSFVTPLVSLRKGDILVTFNTHTLDWRHGHCALVLDADKGILLEHMSVGEVSCTTYAKYWVEYPAFIVLRFPDSTVAEKAADYAQKNLIGIDYNIFAGIVKKDKTNEQSISSHCSHIVWQAYKSVGVDIDQNGGMIVTPKDISLSDKLRVVQIYGINPKNYVNRLLERGK